MARHSEKKSISSRHSDQELSDSECHTAVFEEQSVTSEQPQKSGVDLTAERMDAFKVSDKTAMISLFL